MKEALGFVTLLWNHPILTGLLLLIFTPPFFPLVVYFSPLLMSTALCVVALVSVGSQMEKIKAEGGPGQLANHLGRDHGISRWVPRDSSESMERRHYSHRESHRNPYASSGININVVPAPSSWTAGNSGRELATIRATPQLRPEPIETHPTTPPAEESDEDWWDTWVKEYESRPGWGEQEDQALPTPAIRTSTTSQPVAQAPTPPTIPTPVTARRDRHQDAPPMTPRKPIRQEVRQEEKPPPAAVTAPVVAPVAVSVPASVAAPVAASVSVPVVNRQEAARFLPPPTSTSRSIQDEVVEAVKESDLRPHISLAPIRTGSEKRDVRQGNRFLNRPAAQASEIPPPRSVDVERVSDVQALQSIEKLLHMEMGGSNMATPPVSVARNFASVADMKNARQENSSGTRPQVGIARGAMSPQLNVVKGSGSATVMSTGKGIAVEASEKNRNKIAVGPPIPDDVAGETPLLRHLKTSRSEKQAKSNAYSPLPVRTSRSLMSEKVLPPPQFSPRLLQSLQPLPPKGFSPRLPNLTSAPLGNPVEKIPQWVYDGIPRNRAERAESQAHVKQLEKSEEKHVRAVEQVFSYTRRTHARRPIPVQVDPTTLQGRLDVSTPSTPSLTPAEAAPVSTRKEMTSEQMMTSRVSPHKSASRASSPRRAPPAVVAEIVHTRISDVAVEVAHPADDLNETSSLDSTEMASVSVPTPTALSSRISPSDMAEGSPQRASVAASPRAASPQPASIAASPRPASVASSPQKASVAASPRRASRASSPHKRSIVSSAPWPASVASSPHKLASVGSSPQRASVASSPQRASIAASPRPPSRAPPAASSSPHRSSVPSSPSMPHSRRRRQSSKHCTDKVAFIRIEGSTYYDPPSAAEKEINLVAEEPPSEEYVPIEQDLPTEEIVNSQTLTPRARQPTPPGASPEEDAAAHWGRSYSATRKSRRRLEPRRVVTSQDSDMFSLKTSFSTRNGETKRFVDSSSDDERESVTPRASRRSMGRTIKPLVWRSRSVQAHEPEDSD